MEPRRSTRCYAHPERHHATRRRPTDAVVAVLLEVPMRTAAGHLLTDLRWAMVLLALVVFIVVRWWLQMRGRPQRGSLGEALIAFQASIAGMAALVVAIMFSFQTPVLSSFGVPRNQDAVADPEQLFHLMQMYNRELVSASEAVQALALFGMVVLATGGSLAARVAEAYANDKITGGQQATHGTMGA